MFKWGYRANLTLHQAAAEGDDSFSAFTKNLAIIDPRKKLHLNPWLFNGVLQTLYYSSADSSNRFQIYYGRELFHYADGGVCLLDYVILPPASKAEFDNLYRQTLPANWPRLMPRLRFFTADELAHLQPPNQPETKPLCIVIHGLAGGSHEPLIRNLAENLTLGANAGRWDVVVINNRGCCRTKVTSEQLFTAFSLGDVAEVVEELRRRYPHRPLYAVGFLFGAVILNRYLAESGAAHQIEAACLVGCPWDLVDSSYHIQKLWLGAYLFNPAVTLFLVKLVQNNFKELNSHHPEIFSDANLARAKKFRTTLEFDNTFTSRLMGFDNAIDYYTAAAPYKLLAKVQTPTLILNSNDDPTVGVKLPVKEVLANPNLCMVETDLGGHLGFVQPGGKFWCLEVVEEFFDKFEQWSHK